MDGIRITGSGGGEKGSDGDTKFISYQVSPFLLGDNFHWFGSWCWAVGGSGRAFMVIVFNRSKVSVQTALFSVNIEEAKLVVVQVVGGLVDNNSQHSYLIWPVSPAVSPASPLQSHGGWWYQVRTSAPCASHPALPWGRPRAPPGKGHCHPRL